MYGGKGRRCIGISIHAGICRREVVGACTGGLARCNRCGARHRAQAETQAKRPARQPTWVLLALVVKLGLRRCAQNDAGQCTTRSRMRGSKVAPAQPRAPPRCSRRAAERPQQVRACHHALSSQACNVCPPQVALTLFTTSSRSDLNSLGEVYCRRCALTAKGQQAQSEGRFLAGREGPGQAGGWTQGQNTVACTRHPPVQTADCNTPCSILTAARSIKMPCCLTTSAGSKHRATQANRPGCKPHS